LGECDAEANGRFLPVAPLVVAKDLLYGGHTEP
jgi:hypothetical protein